MIKSSASARGILRKYSEVKKYLGKGAIHNTQDRIILNAVKYALIDKLESELGL